MRGARRTGYDTLRGSRALTAGGRDGTTGAMIRASARFYFAFAGYFAPRAPGGCLNA